MNVYLMYTNRLLTPISGVYIHIYICMCCVEYRPEKERKTQPQNPSFFFIQFAPEEDAG